MAKGFGETSERLSGKIGLGQTTPAGSAGTRSTGGLGPTVPTDPEAEAHVDRTQLADR